jgi:predicted aconitase
MQDSCINNFPTETWGFRTIVTNSGKMAHYAPGTTGGRIRFADLETCINAAVKGTVVL